MFETILLPVDLQDPSSWTEALPIAVQQCETYDAALHILYVLPRLQPAVAAYIPANVTDATRQQEAEWQLAEFVTTTVSASQKTTHQVARGKSVYDEVLKCRKKIGADLIVMAAHRPDLSDYLIGPNAARIVRHAPCSVFVVRK